MTYLSNSNARGRGSCFDPATRFAAPAPLRLTALLLTACLWAGTSLKPTWAQPQQTTPSPLAAENAELRRRLEVLEARVKELEQETKGGKNDEDKMKATVEAVIPITASPPAPRKDEAGGGASVRLTDFFKRTRLSGYLDTYYGFNFNRPASRRNNYRSFDVRHHEFAFNAAEVALEKLPTESSRVGFRLDLLFGPAADFLASTEPGGVEVYKHVQQAYGSYLVSVGGGGLQLDFGKFITWIGAEVDEPADNFNHSRGLLYTLGQPSYHAGARATYTSPGERLRLTGALVNGWSNVEDNNGGKTVGLAAEYKLFKGFKLAQSYTGGPEQAGGGAGWRHFFDTIISYDFNDRFQLLGNYDYAFEHIGPANKVRWQGVAAYLRYSPRERLAFSPRFEWYSDPDGFTTGTPQTLKEVTLTGEYRLRGGLISRVELRRDWSNRAVFETQDPDVLSKRQTTLLGGLTWTFGAGGDESSDDKETPNSSGAVNQVSHVVAPAGRQLARTAAAAAVQASARLDGHERARSVEANAARPSPDAGPRGAGRWGDALPPPAQGTR